MTQKTVAFVVYPGVSLLELVANRTLLGGIIGRSPLMKWKAGYDAVVVGERVEAIPTDTPMAIIPQKPFADVPQPDGLVVIGGGAATTHWAYAERLEAYGARYQPTGWVTDGKFTTAAGVSGAIDMTIGLGAKLTNQATAQLAQLGIVLDPHPPLGRLDLCVSGSVLQSTATPFLAGVCQSRHV